MDKDTEGTTLDNQSPGNTDTGNDDDSSSLNVSEQQGQDTQDADADEHKEKSKFGRKLAAFEKEVAGLKQTISSLNSYILTQAPQRMSQPDDDKPPVDYIQTPEDLEKYETWKQGKVAKQRGAYTQHYVTTIKTLAGMNPELHSEIENELLTNVNEYPTHTGHRDPAFDARENYLRAENKLLKQRLASGRPNVKGGTDKATGLSVNSRMTNAPKATVKLDEYSKKFLQSLGESEDADWVQKSAGRE